MNDKWHKRFLELAETVASWSHDPSTKVGAVLVNELKQIVGLGYNGFPRGVPDSPEDYANREVKYKKVVHAEINAVLNAGLAVRGATLYCTFFPCPQCAACLINAGVKKIISKQNPSDERWAEERKIALEMLVQAGIPVLFLNIEQFTLSEEYQPIRELKVETTVTEFEKGVCSTSKLISDMKKGFTLLADSRITPTDKGED